MLKTYQPYLRFFGRERQDLREEEDDGTLEEFAIQCVAANITVHAERAFLTAFGYLGENC